MIVYLIKSSLCLSIILGVYVHLFEREKMHRFNRYYLLVGLGFSFIVPLITVGFASDILFQFTNVTMGTAPDLALVNNTLSDAESSNSITEVAATGPAMNPFFLITIFYLVIAGLFLFRFSFNLAQLILRILRHKKLSYQGILLVLIKEKLLPHTFLHYVFLNKEAYQHDEIEYELFTHELTHARQRHSLDVLLIEVLQIIFWFNPILILYKRAIQLNHEFLADDQVVNRHQQISDYQHLLLDKAGWSTRVSLASNLNYKITKKRLTMMTKNTSRRKAILIGSLTIPIFICLLTLFGNSVLAQKALTIEQSQTSPPTLNVIDHVQLADAHPVVVLPEAALSSASIPIEIIPEVALSQSTIPVLVVPESYLLSDTVPDLPPPPPPPTPAMAPAPPTPPSPAAHASPVIAPTPPTPPAPATNATPAFPPTPHSAPSLPSAPSPPSSLAAPMPPPPPPPPPAPEEYIRQLAQTGAIFIMDGKEITPEEAIKLASDPNSGYTVNTRKEKGKKRVVTFQKEE